MTGHRDVVLVTVDSLRADYCGFMGHDRDVTPTLDEMASEGLVFENAVAPAPATSGSVPTIFTGTFRSQSADSIADGIRSHMETHVSLPERLSRRGYETIGISANPWMSRFTKFDKGFDRFEDFLGDEDDEDEHGNLGDGNSLVSQAYNWWEGNKMFMTWESFYDDVVAEYERAESPYFLWIFLVDPHMPYLPGDGYRTQSRLLTYLANFWLFAGKNERFEGLARKILLEAYENCIEYTDAFLERLLDDLDDDPLVVVHSDHGEEFGEYSYYGHGPNLYEANVHVPLVVGNGPTGTVSEPFSLQDLPDLVVDLAVDGDTDLPKRPYAQSRNFTPKRAIRGRNWKYVSAPDGDELYEIADGTESELDHPELRELGRAVVDRSLEEKKERERIADAAADLVESGDA